MGWLPNKYASSKCRQCGTRNAVGEQVWYTRGVRGVLCAGCKGQERPNTPSPVPRRPVAPTVAPKPVVGTRKVRRFESWEQYVQVAEDGADKSYGTSHDKSRADWSGTKTFDAALKLARNGWSSVRPTVDALIEKIESKTGEFVQPAFMSYFGVSGGAVDIGRFLDGEPECMVETKLIEIAKPGRVIPILISGFYSSFSEAEGIITRGAGIVALVETLERMQHATEIWIEISYRIEKGQTEGLTYLIPIKAAGEGLDIDKLMFIVANPAAFRRINFAVQESESRMDRDKYGLGAAHSYGRPVDLTQGDEIGAAVKMERLVYGEATADPAVWIEKTLGEFGLIKEEA